MSNDLMCTPDQPVLECRPEDVERVCSATRAALDQQLRSSSYDEGAQLLSPRTESSTPAQTSRPASRPAPARPSPATEIDDAEVQRIIDSAIRSATGTTTEAKVEEAWRDIVNQRRGNEHDMNLMAAEHYLYARSEADNGVGSAALMGILTPGYEVVKAGLDLVGQRDLLSTDGTTPTPPSLGAVEWGMAGTRDGALGG
mgnify:CR=1 FL=1